MKNDRALKDLERLLKPLANKRRLAILRFLKKEGQATVGEIARELRLSMQATSKHLQLLSRADIVESEQVSLSVFYKLSDDQRILLKTALDLL